MPFLSRRARLSLTEEDKGWLEQLALSRTESVARVQRAQMLLRYAQGQTISAVAQALHTNRPRVERCVSKALDLGVRVAVGDLPGLEELKGSGLLDGRLPPGFSVPMPSDDPALRDDEDPLEPGELDLGLAPPPERTGEE